MTQPAQHEGSHNLPQGEQERCTVVGSRIDGSGTTTFKERDEGSIL